MVKIVQNEKAGKTGMGDTLRKTKRNEQIDLKVREFHVYLNIHRVLRKAG